MKVTIKKGKGEGMVSAPPSKSFAHRLILSACLAGEGSKVDNISMSEDILASLDCVKAMGAEFDEEKGSLLVHKGIEDRKDTIPVLPCRESGSTLRFFLPLALAMGEGAILTGSDRLMERGVGIYEQILAPKGISFEKDSHSIIARGRLRPGEYSLLGNVSSQFVTGLLFALPLLDGESVINVIPPVESRPYIDITLNVLREFGIEIKEERENVFFTAGNQKYSPRHISVEGDWSNGAFLLALNALGADVDIRGLKENSIQGDKAAKELLSGLSYGESEIDISSCPDLGPILFAVAAAKSGAHFTGTHRLKIKESDRANAMAEELKKFGIPSVVDDNEVYILKGELHAPIEPLLGHNDHRIVMSLAVLCTLTGGTIDGAEAVNKSWPEFFDTLTKLGIEVEYGA